MISHHSTIHLHDCIGGSGVGTNVTAEETHALGSYTAATLRMTLTRTMTLMHNPQLPIESV